MNRRQFLSVVALVGAASVTACGQGNAAQQADTEAARRFLTERNGGTPVPAAAAMDDTRVAGVVQEVRGSTITLKRLLDGTTAAVELADGATIRQQVDVTLDDLHQGDPITAFGVSGGDAFKADLIQIGDASAGGPVVIGAGPNGLPEEAVSGNNSGDNMVQKMTGKDDAPLGGTVEQIDGDRLTIKLQDGSITRVVLSDQARIQRWSQVEPSTITAGVMLVASGLREGDTFKAAEVDLLPAPPAVR